MQKIEKTDEKSHFYCIFLTFIFNNMSFCSKQMILYLSISEDIIIRITKKRLKRSMG